MINNLVVKNFAGVPYLETSLLMKNHRKGVQFSTEKPNVIVGPNGAGKSALLTALTLKMLCYFTSESSLDNNYVIGNDERRFWSKERTWRTDFEFLPGLTCDFDGAPALYYRPGHIPGNDDSVTAAMMCGYSDEARAYWEATDKKSSGQQSQALQEKLRAALSGEILPTAFQHKNWRFGKNPIDFRATNPGRFVCDFEYKAEVLKNLYSAVPESAKPSLILDEPEQSLDAKAELVLWKQIAKADCSKVQPIVATHSLYPLMHPEDFHLIEAVPGYIEDVRKLM
jgi:predicted ATP-dependent endonuclease of OLD family